VPSHSTCLLPPQALADKVVRTIDHDLTRCKPQIECAESNGGGKKCGFCFCRARDRPKIEKLPSTVQTWVVRPANAIPMQGEQAQASLVLLTICFRVWFGTRRVFRLKGRPILRILILKHIVLFFSMFLMRLRLTITSLADFNFINRPLSFFNCFGVVLVLFFG